MTQTVQQRVSEAEWQTRVDLAACYRIVAHYGWDDLIFTHISARVPGPEHHFLVNPYGMMFEEITASSLVKVDLHGKKVMDSEFDVNPAGFTIHSAVHEAREDAQCVLHLHTNAGVAVSVLEEGLQPYSQTALFPLSNLSYHDYEGIALNPDEKVRLVEDLGNTNFMILRNHGLLTVGNTIPNAFLGMYAMQRACEVQLMAQATGKPLVSIPEPILAGIKAQVEQVTNAMGGALAWPGILRKLDRNYPGFRS
ncbi:class II aldolase/adducin family protein [Alteromonas sp. LMIT006]|jgi:ribulose-5-phosphate 4-epimerase/fuculose-1-phosphate aldolase|uniref:class II aldolase/adducin family protein n=1 Tax=Alteromonadaceae TaxID=72275 RepID=UPI0020CA8738|nr:class II aldolase/adducin family protein [Alteromonas sp. LMIT006]UTP72511.1 class II aldolase/adducin family protein [Alteromonas sp. LMIT006]